MNIKKKIIKWLLPSADELTKMLTSAMQNAVNNREDVESLANIIKKAQPFVDAQEKVARWLEDGKISEEEKLELEAALKPLVEKAIEKAKERL